MIIAVILCPPDLVLLVRSGPVIRDLGGSVEFAFGGTMGQF